MRMVDASVLQLGGRLLRLQRRDDRPHHATSEVAATATSTARGHHVEGQRSSPRSIYIMFSASSESVLFADARSSRRRYIICVECVGTCLVSRSCASGMDTCVQVQDRQKK